MLRSPGLQLYKSCRWYVSVAKLSWPAWHPGSSRSVVRRLQACPHAAYGQTRCIGLESRSLAPATVYVAVECQKGTHRRMQVQKMAEDLHSDAEVVLRAILANADIVGDETSQKEHELSLVVCDDAFIAQLNAEWRGIEAPTDVLSFEMVPDELDEVLPVRVLGDVAISIETATRQADARRSTYGDSYSVRDEMRVLLVHGLLHLLGFDHEAGGEDQARMAAAEARLLSALGWRGAGLIEAVLLTDITDEGHVAQAATSGTSVMDAALIQGASRCEQATAITLDLPERACSSNHTMGVARGGAGPVILMKQNAGSTVPRYPCKVVCLDMDGTLLNSRSQISGETAATLKEALALDGLTVMLATGKARPAAISACSPAGLVGPGGLVHTSGPGVYLQGLATYGPAGNLLPGPYLAPDVVQHCFAFSEDANVACVAFLGDTCVTTAIRPAVRELHTRYYEPLAKVKELGAIMDGPPVRKILLMTDASFVDNTIKPKFDEELQGTGAVWTQAVDTMLEVIPDGINKWVGISQYLEAMDYEPQDVLCVGDGLNDLEMVSNAGCGVAMDNGHPAVKRVADYLTASHDDHGVAIAIENLVLG